VEGAFKHIIASFSNFYAVSGKMNAPNSTTLHDGLGTESLFEQSTTIDIKLFETAGEGAAFRTRNSPGGEVQRPVIKEVEDSGLILQVKRGNVVHGTYTPGGPRATLAIFGFRFAGSVSHERRFQRAAITIHFAFGETPGDTQDPVVKTIIPDGHFVLASSVSKITETTAGTLHAIIPVNSSSLGASFTYQRAQVAQKETRATMFGISLIEGRSYGEPNSVKWVLSEDKQARHGIPDSFTTAVILQPQTAGIFRAIFNVSVEADIVYDARNWLRRFFGEADDPVTFCQEQPPMGSPLGFKLDTQNLSAAVLSLESIITRPGI